MNLNGILIGSQDPQRLTGHCTRLFGDPDDDHLQLVGPFPG